MKKILLSLAILGAALVPLLSAAPAHAQATRTWVSGVGDDVNPCSRTAPCKTFAGAISKTAAGGEINCLDPAGYGAVTITKAITIDCSYTDGSILASGTNGIIVNAGVNDKVIIRGISINGAGTTLGINGIRFLAGAELTVEKCHIFGFSGLGLDISKTTNGNVYVQETYFTEVPTAIRIATTSGAVFASIDRVYIDGPSVNGVEAASTGAVANVTNSVIAKAGGSAVTTSTGSGLISVDTTMITNSLFAINASASGSSIRISNNSMYDNNNQITIGAGATVSTAVNNKIIGGAAPANPNGTAYTIK